MVGNRDRLVTPRGGSFYQLARWCERVHLGHICMEMKLDALLGSLVDNLYLLGGTDRTGVYNKLTRVFVVLNVAHNGDCIALAD